MGYNDDEILGTADGRVGYGDNRDADLIAVENAYIQAQHLAARKRRTVVQGRMPQPQSASLRWLMQHQGFDRENNEWDYSNPVKRASISKIPTREIRIKPDGPDSEGQLVNVYPLTDPYDDLRKFLFEDCYRSDPVVRRCLNLEADLVLGTRTMTILDIDEEFTAEQLAQGIKQKRVEQVLKPDRMEAIQTEIGYIDRDCQIRQKMKAAMIQAGIGGRSVLEKVLDDEGLPVDVRVLNWKKLGTVYVDPKTWKLVAIDYADREDGNPLLPQHIVHFEVDDFHVSPDTLGYGMSKNEAIASVSEINRLLDEVDLKELAKSGWSPTVLFKFALDTSPEVIREFTKSWTPGAAQGTDVDVKHELIDTQGNVESLYNLRMEDDRRITRNYGTPNPVVGFENITNRATIDTTLRFYFDTEVRDLRTWLQDTMEPQWYQPILKILAPELYTPPRVAMNSLSEETRVQLAAVQLPAEQAPQGVLERRRSIRQARPPRVKVKLEFEDVSIEPFAEKVTALMALYGQRLITPKEILKQLNMPHLTEEVEKMAKEQRTMEEQRYKDQIELSKQSIAVGKARQAEIKTSKQQRSVKSASIQDLMESKLQNDNRMDLVSIANANREHQLRMSILEMKARVVSNIDSRINAELAQG